MKHVPITVAAAAVVVSLLIGAVAHAASIPAPEQSDPEILVQEVEVIQEKIVEVPVGEPPYFESIASTITDEEVELLASLVRAEAGNQSYTGQKAVAEVVLHRVMSPKFPNTVTDVIFQQGQFATKGRLSQYPPTDEQYAVVDAVLRESEPVIPGDVMFFATYPFRDVYERIGDHYFCY